MTSRETHTGLQRNFEDLSLIDEKNGIDAIRYFYEAYRQENVARWQDADHNYKMAISTLPSENALSNNRKDDGKKKGEHIYANLIHSKISTLTGLLLEEGKIPTFLAVNEDSETPSQFNKLYLKMNAMFDYDYKLINAFKRCMIAGEAMIQIRTNYTKEYVNGHPDVVIIPHNRYMTADRWNQRNFEDNPWFLTVNDVTPTEAIEMFPNLKKEILQEAQVSFQGSPSGITVQNTGLDNFASFEYGDRQLTSHSRNVINVHELWYRTEKEIQYLHNANNDTNDFSFYSDEEMGEVARNGSRVGLEIRKTKIPTWNLLAVINGKYVGFLGSNPAGFNLCPFVPFIWDRFYEVDGLQSRSRGFLHYNRDLIKITNRSLVSNYRLQEGVNNNLIAYNKRLIGSPEMLHTANKEKIIPIDDAGNENFNIANAIVRLNSPGTNPADLQLSQFSTQLLNEALGVNPILQGNENVDRPTNLTTENQFNASQLSFSKYRRSFELSMRQWGRLWMNYIQALWPAGRVEQELREQPTEVFKKKSFADYDVSVGVGERTETHRNKIFNQLLRIAQIVQLPPEALVKMSDADNRKELLEMIQQRNEQEQKMREMELQNAKELNDARLNLLNAQSLRNTTSALEREERAEANIANVTLRKAEALYKKTQAETEKIKALELLAKISSMEEKIDKLEKQKDKTDKEVDKEAQKQENEIKSETNESKLEIERQKKENLISEDSEQQNLQNDLLKRQISKNTQNGINIEQSDVGDTTFADKQ